MARNDRKFRNNPRPQAQQSQALDDASNRSAFGQFADNVREHPRTAIATSAAGAALGAGAVAAAVLTRGRGKHK